MKGNYTMKKRSDKKRRDRKSLFCPCCQKSTTHVLFHNGSNNRVKWCTVCSSRNKGN